jgi:hypothetical protein
MTLTRAAWVRYWGRMGVRLLRGQVVVREEALRPSVIWSPDPKQRGQTTHRGRVIGMGPPAVLRGIEQPQDFAVGDLVQYHFSGHNQDAFTRTWPDDGLPATWVPQQDVDAVLEP